MIDDVEPCDKAMDAFRSMFHLVANCNVDADDKTMRYRLKDEAYASTWEGRANKIINAHNLPLIAEVKVWKTGSLVHEVSLIITYKAK
jgi:hypothetical protein